jgi:putative Holliday junction resolvase
MQRGRRIAFDYGDVRIGVAVCDPDGILSSPVATLKATDKKLNEAILSLISEYEPVHIYVGKPAHLNGDASQSSINATNFADFLRTLTDVPIAMVDERLSTVTATKQMQSNGVNAKQARSTIDQVAAVSILNFALEIEKNRDSAK